MVLKVLVSFVLYFHIISEVHVTDYVCLSFVLVQLKDISLCQAILN